MLQRDPLEKVRARTQQGLVLLTDITPTVSIFGSAYITRQHIIIRKTKNQDFKNEKSKKTANDLLIAFIV